MKLSVVICTYNRAKILERNLEGFCVQSAQENEYEILVVDNNSNDDTKQITCKYQKKLSNIKYYFEEKQGLSVARNRGCREALGEYICYIDDDAIPTVDYIKIALEIIEKVNPVSFGGPHEPYFLVEKPSWFKPEYGVKQVIHNYTGWLEKEQYFPGLNMFFRKDILIKYGGFSEKFGMIGNELKYGEETYLFDKITADNHQLYYDSRLLVLHLVSEYEMNIPYFISMYFEMGRTAIRYKVDNNMKLPVEFQDLKDWSYRYQLELEKVILNFDEIVKKIRTKGGFPYEQKIVDLICKENFYYLGILHELQFYLSSKKNSFWNKIYKLNLETLIKYFYRR